MEKNEQVPKKGEHKILQKRQRNGEIGDDGMVNQQWNGESATRNGESTMTEWRIGDGMVKSRTRNGELTTTKCRIGEGMVNQQRWNGESAMRNGELVTEG